MTEYLLTPAEIVWELNCSKSLVDTYDKNLIRVCEDVAQAQLQKCDIPARQREAIEPLWDSVVAMLRKLSVLSYDTSPTLAEVVLACDDYCREGKSLIKIKREAVEMVFERLQHTFVWRGFDWQPLRKEILDKIGGSDG